MQKLRSIQMLRGIAVLGVVALHTLDVQAGAAGVDLFFVISGFIIGKVMVGRAPLPFVADRFWRIFPLYWICLLPWLAVAWATHQLDAGRLASSLILWPIFGGHFAPPYLKPAWSLCYEMLFYYSATIALATGRGRWLIGIFLALFALNLVYPSALAGFLGYPLIVDFLLGLAVGKLKLDARIGGAALGMGAVLVIIAPASYFVQHTLGVSDVSTVRRVLYWGVPSAMVVYGALSLERFARFTPLVVLGDASYAIYLTHMISILFAGHGPIGLGVSIMVGLCAHVWIEKPLLRLRHRFSARTIPAVIGWRSHRDKLAA